MTGKFRPLISLTVCTNQIHFPKKQLRKPETGIKGDFDEMEHEFLLGTFGTQKRYLFFSEILLLTEVFLIGMT